MNSKKHLPEKRRRAKHPMVVTLMSIVGIIAILYAMSLYQQSLTPEASAESSLPSDINLTLETTVSSIAKQFICTCGKCGDLSLDVCTCPDAGKERETIRQSLRTGQSPDQVIALVNDTYGGMKPQKQAN